jgi:hypothetical protein
MTVTNVVGDRVVGLRVRDSVIVTVELTTDQATPQPAPEAAGGAGDDTERHGACLLAFVVL